MSLRSSTRVTATNTNNNNSTNSNNNSNAKNIDHDHPPTPNPIIFVHGIGVGFVHYLGLIFNFPTDVDVYLVEWPHVAYQMSDRAPTIEETVGTMLRMLDDGGHEQVRGDGC
jgi:hypothetical protein